MPLPRVSGLLSPNEVANVAARRSRRGEGLLHTYPRVAAL